MSPYGSTHILRTKIIKLSDYKVVMMKSKTFSGGSLRVIVRGTDLIFT